MSRRVLLLVTLGVMTLTCFLLGLDYLFFTTTSFGGILSIVLLLFYISAFEAGIGESPLDLLISSSLDLLIS